MKLEKTKKFTKQAKNLSKKERNKLFEKLRLFADDPFNEKLRTHPLKGNLIGMYSFSISGNLRVHFKWMNNKKTKLLLITLGTRSSLYK